jgi:outer membrane protein assembly factor BamB
MKPHFVTAVLAMSGPVHGALASYPHGDTYYHPVSHSEWKGWGGDIQNNRWVSQGSDISSSNIGSLANLGSASYAGELSVCKKTFAYGVSATPTLLDGIAYFPSWDGNFYALDYHTCSIRWSLNVTTLINDFKPIAPSQLLAAHADSRTSPQINGNVVHFGTQLNALAVAVDIDTGRVLDTIQINPHPFAIITSSPAAYDNMLVIGSSSNEELAPGIVPGYVCCTFKGNVVALTFENNKYQVAWNVSMISANRTGWAGAAIWGSQPSIDTARNQVFIGTGNTYAAPDGYESCESNQTNITTTGEGSDPCLPADVWQECVVALDVNTGKVNWVHHLTPLDAWIVACGWPPSHPRNTALCPNTPGPDAGKSRANGDGRVF